MNAIAEQSAAPKWIRTTLGAVTEEKVSQMGPQGRTEFVYVDISSIDNKTKRVVEPKTLPVGHAPSRAKQNLKAGDVLVSMTRPNLNAVALVPPELDGAVGSTGFHVLRARQAEPSWLFYSVQTHDFIDAMCRLVQGALYPAVRPKDIRVYPVPLPPLDEQRRIVAEIEKQFTRLEVGVVGLRRVQANLKRYRAAVLKAACEGKLVPTEPADPAGRVGWKQVELGEVVESMKNGIYKPRNFYVDDGIACLRMYNIENGKIVWKDVKRMRLTRDEEREYGLLPGDLLVNRVNSRELVGKAAPIPVGLEPCVFESKNIRVRLKRDLADPRFIGFAMSVYGPMHFNRNAQQVVGMASISQPQVSALEIPLPPLAEQERIVAEVERRLSVVEELEAVISANLQRATRLRQAVLQQAFEGKLVKNQYERTMDEPQDLPLAAESPSSYGDRR